MIIAIDGPSGSGKGTLSRRLAQHYNLEFLDTGMLYRAVAEKAVQEGLTADQRDQIIGLVESLDLNKVPHDKLKADDVAQMASQIAVIPEVRKILVEFMQEFAQNPPKEKKGVVLDGRDIGTVVCPQADYKFFLTSAVEVRANRRHKELLNIGIKSIYSKVLSDMIARDKRDSEREDSPLRPAADAHIIDTSEKSIDEVLITTIQIIDSGRSHANSE